MSPCPICRRPATALYQSPARGECADPGGRGCLMLALTMATTERGELLSIVEQVVEVLDPSSDPERTFLDAIGSLALKWLKAHHEPKKEV